MKIYLYERTSVCVRVSSSVVMDLIGLHSPGSPSPPPLSQLHTASWGRCGPPEGTRTAPWIQSTEQTRHETARTSRSRLQLADKQTYNESLVTMVNNSCFVIRWSTYWCNGGAFTLLPTQTEHNRHTRQVVTLVWNMPLSSSPSYLI